MNLKELKEYRKNKKTVKREITKIGATTLPLLSDIVEKRKDTMCTIIALFDACKGKTGDELREEFIGKLAGVIHDESVKSKQDEYSENLQECENSLDDDTIAAIKQTK